MEDTYISEYKNGIFREAKRITKEKIGTTPVVLKHTPIFADFS